MHHIRPTHLQMVEPRSLRMSPPQLAGSAFVVRSSMCLPAKKQARGNICNTLSCHNDAQSTLSFECNNRHLAASIWILGFAIQICLGFFSNVADRILSVFFLWKPKKPT